MSSSFRFLITDEDLPGDAPAMPHSDGPVVTVLVNREALHDDPEGMLLAVLGPMFDEATRAYVRKEDLRAVS